MKLINQIIVENGFNIGANMGKTKTAYLVNKKKLKKKIKYYSKEHKNQY